MCEEFARFELITVEKGVGKGVVKSVGKSVGKIRGFSRCSLAGFAAVAQLHECGGMWYNSSQ